MIRNTENEHTKSFEVRTKRYKTGIFLSANFSMINAGIYEAVNSNFRKNYVEIRSVKNIGRIYDSIGKHSLLDKNIDNVSDKVGRKNKIND